MSANDRSPLFDHSHTDNPVFLPGNMLKSAKYRRICHS
jgi:hypothetical protein